MNSYTIFQYFIIVVKLLFALTLIIQLTQYINLSHFTESFYETNSERKEKLENLYIFLMSILLIIIFRNRSKKTRKFSHLELELLLLFGFVLAIKTFVNWLKQLRDKNINNKETNVISDAIEVTTDVFIPLS